MSTVIPTLRVLFDAGVKPELPAELTLELEPEETLAQTAVAWSHSAEVLHFAVVVGGSGSQDGQYRNRRCSR